MQRKMTILLREPTVVIPFAVVLASGVLAITGVTTYLYALQLSFACGLVLHSLLLMTRVRSLEVPMLKTQMRYVVALVFAHNIALVGMSLTISKWPEVTTVIAFVAVPIVYCILTIAAIRSQRATIGGSEG